MLFFKSKEYRKSVFNIIENLLVLGLLVLFFVHYYHDQLTKCAIDLLLVLVIRQDTGHADN